MSEFSKGLFSHEKIQGRMFDKTIRLLMSRWGFYAEVFANEVYPEDKRNFENLDLLSKASYQVYGEYSGLKPIHNQNKKSFDYGRFRVLLSNRDFSSFGSGVYGELERQILYTENKELSISDKLMITRDDGATSQWVVGDRLALGVSSSIYTCYYVDYLGEFERKCGKL